MNLNTRNYPPQSGIRVPAEEMKALTVRLFEAVDMTGVDAEVLANILNINDRRCLFSHGTRQVPYYLQRIKDGDVNPRPNISVVSEAPGALVMDGDGGLGYFPCYEGTKRIIEKARQGGVAVLTTRNHQHFGSAGNYTRMAVAADCIGISASSHRTFFKPDSMIYNVVDTSPMSIGIPAGEQPPLVMDMGGVMIRFDEELFKRLPTTYFKAMALTSAIRALGGVFAGIYKDEYRDSIWQSNQGSFIAVVNVAHFMPVDELKQEMDCFIGDARKTKPLPGMESAELAGGNEWGWDKENAEKGIPIGDGHREALQDEADKLSVETPFSRFEETRF
ncbi:MAG: Ldh family oxidoreductase [Candidatus Latescibacteria bacterium]|jgi:LDH2 family malate/lactate/ureidoglycolate dehydrogenase|nr:Ldh family oxidoreductase [Candidatus Latescibacterota bacterium]